MKYKVVKEINMCEGCINDRREMCSDFKKQRMSEGLPSCSKGIIYVEDSTVEEYKDITLDMSVKEIMALDLERVEFLSSPKWIKTFDKHTTIIQNLLDGLKYRYKPKPLKPMKITQQLMNDLLDCICNKEEIEKKYGRKVEIIE